MALLRPVIRGLRALFRPRQADRDVADEVAHYQEAAEAEHRSRGLSPEAARRAARLEMGGDLALREEVRASGWEHAVETTLLDVRHAFRRLRLSPVFTVTAVLTFAVGIGAATAVFSTVKPILLEPLPFPAADRLVTLDDRNDQGTPMPATLGTYDEVRARAHGFEALAAADPWRPSLTGLGTPERLEGRRVTADYFRVFGAVPLTGRDITPADDQPGAPAVVMLSYALAERRFGGARAAVGRTIRLDDDPYLVAGVMPPGFVNVLAPAVEIWSPLRERSSAVLDTRMWGHHYQLVARLTPSSGIAAATRELLAIGRAPLPDFPRPPWSDLAQGLLVRPLQDAITRSARPALLAIVAAVALLLTIASVNVANLLLARGARRRSEFAMRIALGAGRRRLLRQLVTESVVLATLGGGLGLALAPLGVRALVAASPPGMPRIEAIRLDASVFLFATTLTSLVGLLVGLAPAFGALRATTANRQPRTANRHTTARAGLRGALVVAEVALALTLLVSAGLLFRSVRQLLSVEPGFDPTGVVTLQVVQAGRAFDSDAARLAFYDQALAQVRALPGVEDAAFTSLLPLSGEVDGYGYEVEALPDQNNALRNAVSPDYFATMRIPLVAGRLLDPSDRPGAPPAVVINQRFARRVFGDADPLGRRLRFGPQMGTGTWMQVVGVVGDVRHYSLAVDPPDVFYLANGQWEWADNVETLVVRAAPERAVGLIPSLERAVWQVNPNVPIARIRPMADFVRASAGTRRFTLLAIQTLALTALLLAALGLYGVVSGNVTERVREIGIRTALGASPGDVVSQVVRHAVSLTLTGAAIGLVGAFGGSRLIGSMLFGVSPLDPLTYGAVMALLAAVALLAAWAPARRAAAVDPTVALRAE